MAAILCFTFRKEKGNYSAKFQSTDGEDYIAKCNVINTNYGDGSLILEWSKASSKFIRLSSYRENDNHMLFDTILIVKDKVTASLPFRCPSAGVFVLNVVPRLNLTKVMAAAANPAVQNQIPAIKERVVERKLEKLSIDMKALLQTGGLSDIVLTDGSKEIRAHKFMLHARSSVFAKMFQHPTKENLENRVTIKDISVEVLKELLHFMYTGTIVIKDSKMAGDLYVAADKYDIKDLRDICSGMMKLVDLNNVLDTLLLANLYNDRVLKEAALCFISNNYPQLKVLQTWKSFMKEHQTLAIEILSYVIDKNVL